MNDVTICLNCGDDVFEDACCEICGCCQACCACTRPDVEVELCPDCDELYPVVAMIGGLCPDCHERERKRSWRRFLRL